MATTKKLIDSITWAEQLIFNKPLTTDAGIEPALSFANHVQATITGPPFSWRWNRALTTFSTTAATQDYSKSLASFGFLEKASVNNIELTYQTILGTAAEQARPAYISDHLDDNAGNITFRFLPIPDAVYTASVTYQKTIPLLTGVNDKWGIPDQYSYIYDAGFLALAFLYNDDPRYQLWNQKFVSALLGAQQGISDLERNIFVGNWVTTQQTVQSASLKTQIGNTARGQ